MIIATIKPIPKKIELVKWLSFVPSAQWRAISTVKGIDLKILLWPNQYIVLT